jgi:hypothetical protein
LYITVISLFLSARASAQSDSTIEAQAPASWGPLQIAFDESAFPVSTTNLVNAGSPGPVVFEYDVLTQGTTSTCGGADRVYTQGADGTPDLRLTATLVTKSGLLWEKTEGDYSTVSSGSFRSDWRTAINSGNSRPNDYAYVKFDFEFLNGLELSNTASQFATRHTSTNGETELYEWTQVTINGTSINEAAIGNYTNIIYNAMSSSAGYFDATGTVINPGAATNAPLANNRTMSEFLDGQSTGTYAPGGLIKAGWWAIDDFNTTILDGPEAATTNPATGNGSVDDDQTVTGINFGLANNTLVQQITYYFGITDVAFDTDGNGFTQTNSSPAAGVTWFEVGIAADDCPTAIELVSFSAETTPERHVALNWETATERDNAGFNIFRSPTATFDASSAVQINESLIAAEGSLGQGASYTFTDSTVPSGVWYYFLEDIDMYGVRTQYGPVIVDASAPTSAALSRLSGTASESDAIWLTVLTAVMLIGLAAQGFKRKRDVCAVSHDHI